MTAEPPVWGTPPPSTGTAAGAPGVQDVPQYGTGAPAQGQVHPPQGYGYPPPPHQVHWQSNPAGIGSRPHDPATIRRQAGVALVVNLLVLFIAAGFMSAGGAAMALRARSLSASDPVRAQRSLTWSWLLLASNLLLYVLLGVLFLLLLVSILSS